MNLANLAVRLLRQADPTERAADSFDGYHSPHLSYLNLCRSPELTAKVYLIRGAALHQPLVNPHDHAYAFRTEVLFGRVEHRTFRAKSDDGKYGDLPANRFTWDATQRRAVFAGADYLSLESYTEHARGSDVASGYDLDVRAIHTIAPASKLVALFLLQFRDRPSVLPTRLWVPDGSCLLDTAGLYRPMTPERYAGLRDLALDLV